MSVIDRSQDARQSVGPIGKRRRLVVWTSRRGTHLGSGHVRPRQQTGHMIASDRIHTNKLLQPGGRPHMGNEYVRLKPELRKIEARLMAWHRGNELSRRLAEIPSVGPIGATLSVMKVGNPHAFRSGRDFSAWLGMTPKDHSTAGKVRLGAITKAGDEALRSVLVAGATSVIQQVRKGRGRPSPWLVALVKRKPPKLAAVALANKTARIIWKLMVSGERYNPQRARQHFVPPTDSLAPGKRRQGQAACGGDRRSALTARALRAPSAPPSA